MPGSYTVSTPSGPRSIGRRMPKTAAPVSPDAAARAAANATRRADVKKMMSERAEAKKISDASARAKKAESDKAAMATMEASRAKNATRAAARRASASSLKPNATAADKEAAIRNELSRQRARAAGAKKTATPTTGLQNTGPENVGARPVPMARYKKGGSVSCKTY